MKKSLFQFYALLVCFSMLICFTFWFVAGSYALFTFIKPDYGIRNWDTYQTNDAYWSSYRNQAIHSVRYSNKDNIEIPRPDENQLTYKRNAAYELALKAEKRESIQTLIKGILVTFIVAIFFWMHWRIAKKVAESN